MEKYKCPACGSKKYVDVDIISNKVTSEMKTVDINSVDRYGRGIDVKRLECAPRGLINYDISVAGDASLYSSFSGNCTARICTECGFVSLNAFDIAQQILKEYAMLDEKDSALKIKKDELAEQKEKLQKQINDLEQRIKKIEIQLQDENITIKQQKDLQVELKESKELIKRLYYSLEKADGGLKAFSDEQDSLVELRGLVKGHKVVLF